MVDVVPQYRGYCAAMTRTFVIGSATGEQRRMIDTYRKAQAAGIAALREGVRNRDIDTTAQEVFTAEGYGRFLRVRYQPQHRFGF